MANKETVELGSTEATKDVPIQCMRKLMGNGCLTSPRAGNGRVCRADRGRTCPHADSSFLFESASLVYQRFSGLSLRA